MTQQLDKTLKPAKISPQETFYSLIIRICPIRRWALPKANNFMFKDQKKDTDVKQAETIIGASVKVKGNFHGDGNIIIEGEVEGSVKTKNFLLIGKSAKISADVTAKDARVGGKVSGNIKVQGYLEIESSARINGDILAKELSIEKGAILNGTCHMGDSFKGDENKK